jgi:hypothetical protein
MQNTHTTAPRVTIPWRGLLAVAGLAIVLLLFLAFRDTFDPIRRAEAQRLAERAATLDAQLTSVDLFVTTLWRLALPALGLGLAGAAGYVGLVVVYNRWAQLEVIKADKVVALAQAQAQIFPANLQSLNYSDHSRRELAEAPPSEETPPQLAAPLQLDAGRPLLAQLRERGHICRSGKSLMVGHDATNQPLYIEMPECGFIGVGGQPRVGKTTLVTLLLAQAALMDWYIALGDPHIHKEDGLIQRCLPISGHTFRQASTPEEIAAMIRLVDKIGRRRVNGDPDRQPVLMVLDEFTNLVIRGLLPDDVLAALPAMALEYAGVGVHGIIIGHDWNARLLGDPLGAALRRAITHRLVCRSDAGNAEFLLHHSALARQAASLQKGQVLYWGTDAPTVVSVPRIGQEDLVYAAQGAPPRPYQRPQPAIAGPAPRPAATIPPTERVTPPRGAGDHCAGAKYPRADCRLVGWPAHLADRLRDRDSAPGGCPIDPNPDDPAGRRRHRGTTGGPAAARTRAVRVCQPGNQSTINQRRRDPLRLGNSHWNALIDC